MCYWILLLHVCAPSIYACVMFAAIQVLVTVSVISLVNLSGICIGVSLQKKFGE